MFNTLYLLNYNNYYNRIVKQEQTIEDYMDYVVYTVAATNFNPNDNINTEHIVNIDDSLTPDYAILINESGEIVSRWFIVESERIRGGQWKLYFHRDVIVDFYNIIIESPCFIEKANLDVNNPLIFNYEDMTFNQIKKAEYLLKDESNSAWLVAYCAKDATNLSGSVSTNLLDKLSYIPLNSSIQEWEFYEYTTNLFKGPAQNGQFELNIAVGPVMSPVYYRMTINEKTGACSFRQIAAVSASNLLQYIGAISTADIASRVKQKMHELGLSNFNADNYSFVHTQARTDELNSYNGKLLEASGEFYNCSISTTYKNETISIESGNLFNYLNTLFTSLNFIGPANTQTFKYNFSANNYTVNLKRKTNIGIDYNITEDALRIVTEDAPYNIIAIPYNDITIKGPANLNFTNSQAIAISTIMSIQEDHQTNIYDIQLLPYCPVPDLISNPGEITFTSEHQFSKVIDKNGGNTVSVIVNVPNGRFEGSIPFTIKTATSALERKVKNECDKYRLVSPNYSNYFDFSAEKNYGVSLFTFDCDYKPYNPYIHINPDFKGLYGNDYNDPRGLVCGGDFSLAQIGDAWKQYQIQNKNFQASFDRQIQNMELTNSIQKKVDVVSAIAGTLQGGVSGAMTGGMTGGGVRTAIGGVAGAVASGIAGIADVRYNEMLRNETIDYTRDQFGYQLGNIQALPQTISKISAFNNNNKIFPVLEYYSCSEEEKNALRNKIKYNGMTVMVIDILANYLQSENTYIKGKIIRLENLNDDFHVAKTIAAEINQGIFI